MIVFFSYLAKNNFVENCPSNETSDDFWDYQEQVFNGLQENNTNNDQNIIEKCLRLACIFMLKIPIAYFVLNNLLHV